jgi:hypothetical protein
MYKKNLNLEDFKKFYDELKPFIERLGDAEPELYSDYVNKYISNREALENALKSPFSLPFILSEVLEYFFDSRKKDELIGVIREIRGNAENLEYSLTINR